MPHRHSRASCLKTICWIIVPVSVAALLTLSIYCFSTERLIVLSIGLLSLLLPFCSEVTIKGISVKRDKPKTGP